MNTVKAKDIREGSFLYPKNFAAIRLVVAINERGAHWLGFDRSDGHQWDQGFCSLQRLASWADRFCTDEEAALIKRANPDLVNEVMSLREWLKRMSR